MKQSKQQLKIAVSFAQSPQHFPHPFCALKVVIIPEYSFLHRA